MLQLLKSKYLLTYHLKLLCLTHFRNLCHKEFCPEINEKKKKKKTQTRWTAEAPVGWRWESTISPSLQCWRPRTKLLFFPGKSFHMQWWFMNMQNKQSPNDATAHAYHRLPSHIYLLDFTSQGGPHNDFDKTMWFIPGWLQRTFKIQNPFSTD